ncbi:PAS domain-containing sensor histidine kinase [Marinomonas sp. CT5]|uniref:PAS domain-containing sensor histidine kinase n=1 Tax=Marinomonas sp. CT5 TaxID=2066133 RepID=UPI001BAF8104|nr:PAS domain-containing sensor histidine kinase [Marinomonas sp. CT5]QUX96296.1 PAS domain-containing sensor histidine kinase [Marinomonas sp. CT5]
MDHPEAPDNIKPIQNNQLVGNEFLQQLITYLPMGAMVVNTDATIVFVNDSLSEVLGYTKTEFIGADIDFLLPAQFQANHKKLMMQFFKEPRKRKMGDGQALYARKKDGKHIPIEIGLNPIQQGEKTFVLATLIDLTSRHKARDMFQRSIQHAPHGVLVIDASGIIRLTNSALCNSFGYTSEELINQPMNMLLPHRYRHHHDLLRHSFHQDPKPRMMGVGRDLTALHKDGREFPVEIGLSPCEDEEDNEMVLVSLLDITKRKRLEQELRETNTNLEEFTYVASHDLRSPLRGISDLLEWVKEDLGSDSPPEVTKNLDRIDVRIQRMEQLIDNLLTYARAGKVESITQDINVNALFDNIFELLEVPKGITVTRNIQLEHFTSVWTPLETVMRNLISNAIKHHDQSTGSITIGCSAENNLCHFTICDDGPGIPEAAFTRIFRLFQTVTSGERSGTGIGLSVSRRLVETHGGRISVEANQHQRGVTFHVWWPRFLRRDTHD